MLNYLALRNFQLSNFLKLITKFNLNVLFHCASSPKITLRSEANLDSEKVYAFTEPKLQIYECSNGIRYYTLAVETPLSGSCSITFMFIFLGKFNYCSPSLLLNMRDLGLKFMRNLIRPGHNRTSNLYQGLEWDERFQFVLAPIVSINSSWISTQWVPRKQSWMLFHIFIVIEN